MDYFWQDHLDLLWFFSLDIQKALSLNQKMFSLDHLVTSVVGVIILKFLPIDLYLQIAIAVGLGIFAMILLGVTHPPAGGNPIVIILGAASYNFLINPIIFGSMIIIVFAIILNRFILKKNYPSNWKS